MNNFRTLVALSILFIAQLPMVNAGVITQGTREPYRPLIQRQGSEPPLNMIVVGKDHRLWYEAYNDASDLDGDGSYDVDYKGYILKSGESVAGKGKFKIDYYGYFDSYKCYTYDTTNKRFNPSYVTTTKKCNGSTWSGDFLNYVTTPRIDAIRKVLYGGYRAVDTTTETVLQRAWLPQDAHSWGKEHSYEAETVVIFHDDKGDPIPVGYKINDYTPYSAPKSGKRHIFASTTLNTGSVTNPPVLRVVTNATFRVWNWLSQEGNAARDSYNVSPNNFNTWDSSADNYLVSTNFEVKVKVCDSSKGLEDNCKLYGTKIYKPTGLIQQYGDTDKMRFGLLTGSYLQNLQGGLLRKNIGVITDEVDPTTGIIKEKIGTQYGIIGTLNTMRIEGWNGSVYDCGWPTQNAMTDGSSACTMWGNPIGEMVYEAVRYFAGKTPNSDYGSGGGNSNATNKVTLTQTDWTNPYGLVNGSYRNSICSKPYITLISESNPSWDDKLPGSAFISVAEETFSSYGQNSTTKAWDVPQSNSFNASTFVDKIWGQEFGTSSKNVVIGETSSIADQAPTTKATTNFSSIRGMPEEPTKRGTYYAAGAAYFARINDINAAPEEQKIMTMAVAMASPLPKIEIPISGTCPGTTCKMIKLTPYAKSVGGSSINKAKDKYQPTNQIVDFYIDKIINVPGFPSDTSNPVKSGGVITDIAGNSGRPYYKFRINYEDVEYGADHDMDAISIYEISKNADNTVTVKVTSEYAAGGIDQHMGYVISGTTNDGVYLVVKDQSGGDVAYWQDVQCMYPVVSTCTAKLTALSDTRTFTPNSGAATITELQPPLYYVGKYGSFIDADTNVKSSGYNFPDKDAEWTDPTDATKTPSGYFLVTNPANLEKQLGQLFARIDSTSRSTAPIGSGGSSAATSLRVYRSYFQMDHWSGGVAAMTLDASGNTTNVWDTKDHLTPFASRKIFTHNGTNSLTFDTSILNTGAVASAKLNSVQMAEIKKGLTTSNEADRLQYLRGDKTKEGTTFRTRETAGVVANYFADILDAQPYTAGAPTHGNNADNKGYESYRTEKDGANKTYFDYAASNLLTYRRSKLFIGANDGMLHIIDDSQQRDSSNMDTGVAVTSTETTPDPVSALALPGKELMAYMPSFVYTRKDLSGVSQSKISEYSKLTGYNHEFFVNGQVAMADMIYGLSGVNKNWTTVLAGTVGFGGKGIYALNVTPDVFNGTANDHVMFEYTADMDVPHGVVDPANPASNLSDIGYISGRPLLGKTNDGAWRVVVGNGYNSDSGEAVLKLININDLSDVVTLRTGEGRSKLANGTPTPLEMNGLSTPAMVDGVLKADGSLESANGTMDVVYAGDLKGNLWRFDLTSSSKADWSVSKLFKASAKCTSTSSDDCVQPITVRPAVAAYQQDGKTVKLVLFGTGKVIEDCDKTAVGCTGEAYMNSFYAIRDYDDVTKNAKVALDDKRGKLLPQVIKTYKSGADQQQYFRYIEGNTKSTDCKDVKDSGGTVVGKQCPSEKVAYADDPTATGAQLGWYQDLPEVSKVSTDDISSKVVGDIQVVGSGPLGIVKYSTFAPVNAQEACELKGISGVMVPNVSNGGQTLSRLTSGDLGKNLVNVGVVFDKAYPSGSTILNNAKPAGLGDTKGAGDCYNCDGKTKGKTVLVTPDIGQEPKTDPSNKKWDVLLRKGIVVPVNWREVSETDVE